MLFDCRMFHFLVEREVYSICKDHETPSCSRGFNRSGNQCESIKSAESEDSESLALLKEQTWWKLQILPCFRQDVSPSGGQSLPGSVSGHLAHQHGLGLTLSLPSATPQSGIKPGTLTTCE